ncbi:DUF4846 domain-containing protein [Lacibacter sp. H407]|uniref:DUF4846 domain-containing protein n=1 Tax=Lacibacter sp. H407 TaxID=3133423 RepID=UPI0030C30C64
MNAVAFFFASICFLHLNGNKTDPNSSTSISYPKQTKEINLPHGYERIKLPAESFGVFLRKQPLKKETTVYLYNGQPKYNQTAQYAVLDVSVGKRDLQQCADAVMRLRAEYLKQQQLSICFADNAGKKYCWEQYKNRGWQSYLETVFGMCGTLSLEKELKPKTWDQVTVGDVLIKGGSPGHAVIIMDLARHRQTGDLIFLLAQSYMPAQDIHILQNKNEKMLSPWYRVPKANIISTPEWTFYANQLRSWR